MPEARGNRLTLKENRLGWLAQGTAILLALCGCELIAVLAGDSLMMSRRRDVSRPTQQLVAAHDAAG